MQALRTFIRDRSGAAAVEFAIIVPVLAAILIGLMLAWEPATAMLRMRAAVHAGATYVRNGGSNDANTSTAVSLAWERKPSSAVIAVTRECLCSTTVHLCTTACSDKSAPMIYVTVAASETNMSRTFGKTLARSEIVRVR